MPETIRYSRQNGIIDVADFVDNEIAIIGCGANGSFIAISLAKMGFTKFQLWDFDRVEEHNLPNQFFAEDDIGENKAEATKKWMLRFNSKADIKVNGRYSREPLTNQIVISCVDRMDVRRQIFSACQDSKKVQLFVDTRMAGLQGQIYFVDMTDKKMIDNYRATLFSDDEAVQLRCTERSILFTVQGIASMVCCQIVKALKGEEFRNYMVLDFVVPQMI